MFWHVFTCRELVHGVQRVGGADGRSSRSGTQLQHSWSDADQDQDWSLPWIRGSCHHHRTTRLNLKRISASLQPWYQPCHWSPRARCRGQLQVATFSWQLLGLPLQLKSVLTSYWGEESSWWRRQPLVSWLNPWSPTILRLRVCCLNLLHRPHY